MSIPVWQPATTYVPGAVVVPSSSAPVTTIQPTNAGFETGDITGWTADDGSRWAVTTDHYAGTYGAKCSGNGLTSLNNNARPSINVGQSVTVSAMLKITNAGTDDAFGQVVLVFFDSGGIALPGYIPGSSVSGVGGFWNACTASGAAPAGAASFTLRVSINPGSHGSTVQVDQGSFTYAYAPPPAGIVYKATQAAPGKSGSSEPIWPGVGSSVTDNQVTWQGEYATRLVWQASPILQSGATKPVWPTQNNAVIRDGTIDWTARSAQSTDPNCPQSKIVAIGAGKVFAADNDIVRYCATVNPLDWSAVSDAGYLPTGLQTYGSNPVTAMGLYRSNLVVYNAEGFQMWQLDPDPANIALLDALPVASVHNPALAPTANDLFFLSSQGVRSMGISSAGVNLEAGDVGMPIDALIKPAMVDAAAYGVEPIGTYIPSMGQFWLAFPHHPVDPLALSGKLPSGLPNVAVNYRYTASGGRGPYVFSLASGALPTGLTMDATGLVTGQRTALSPATWVVQVVDANGTVTPLNDSDTPLAAYAAWEPMTLPAAGSLSASNSTLAANGNTAGCVFATGPIGDKRYFEAQVATIASGDTAEAGLACSDFDRRSFNAGATTLSLGVQCQNGAVLSNNVSLGSLGAGALGGSIRLLFAVDGVSRKVWVGAVGMVGWVGGGDPVAGTSPTYTMPGTGRLWPAASIHVSGATVQYISNPAQFSAAVPSGFTGGVWDILDTSGFTTLDPQATSSSNTLSNGNLTATNTSSALSYGWTASTRVKRKGKPYWEITAQSGVNSQDRCTWGICTEGEDYLRYFSPQALARGYGISSSGKQIVGTTLTALTAGINTGDIIRQRMDMTAGTYDIAVNGGAWMNIVTGLSGPGWRTVMAAYYGSFFPEGGTCNFGASAFAYAVPTGYDAGWLADGP